MTSPARIDTAERERARASFIALIASGTRATFEDAARLASEYAFDARALEDVMHTTDGRRSQKDLAKVINAQAWELCVTTVKLWRFVEFARTYDPDLAAAFALRDLEESYA